MINLRVQDTKTRIIYIKKNIYFPYSLISVYVHNNRKEQKTEKIEKEKRKKNVHPLEKIKRLLTWNLRGTVPGIGEPRQTHE